MSMYMLMAKYSAAALKAIGETGTDRQTMARKAIEAAGGKPDPVGLELGKSVSTFFSPDRMRILASLAGWWSTMGIGKILWDFSVVCLNSPPVS